MFLYLFLSEAIKNPLSTAFITKNILKYDSQLSDSQHSCYFL